MAAVCAALGALAGWIASLPVTVAFRAHASVARGLGGIILSFFLLVAIVAALRSFAGTAFVASAAIAVLTFLGFVTAAGVCYVRAQG